MENTNSKMPNINPTLSVTTLNKNRFSIPIKRQRLTK